MDRLPVSVVVAAKDVAKTLDACLTTVQKNNPAEIIVVDGKSTDKTIEIAESYGCRIYSDHGMGFNYAQQLGVEKATQEYIALVDADITLSEGILARLLTELKGSNCISMQATVLGVNLSSYWERAGDWNFRLFQSRGGNGLCCAVLRRDTILQYKFDSWLKGGGDHDFTIRMKKAGYKMGTSSAVVYHQHRADLRSYFKQRFRDGQVAARMIWKWGLWANHFGPPVTRAYWIIICLLKGKPLFIPYFIVDSVAETSGMIKGFYNLIIETKEKK